MQKEAARALIEAGIVSADTIEAASVRSRSNKKPLLVNLFEGCSAVTQADVTDTLAKFYNIPVMRLDGISPPPNLVRKCKLEQARQWYFLPVSEQGSHVVVGMIDPTDLNNVDMLQHIFRKPVQPVFIHAHDFENGLYRIFRKSDERPVESAQLIDTVQLQHVMTQKAGKDDGDTSEATIAGRFVRHVISRALTYGASSLAIEPKVSELLISLNIEGGVYRLFRLSQSHHGRVLTALKKMIGLEDKSDAAGSRRRSILLRFNGREYKLLFHFHPSPEGECATIRIVDPRYVGMSLDQLGLSSDIEAPIKAALAGTGLILVTGPFGSGKSSTLMAFLRQLTGDGARRIISMEDLAIEKLAGVKQVQLPSGGTANAAMLKSALHHAPDVVVIDEVTDEETIAMSLHAANSGRCLLILCMEADGIAEALSRLLRMGLDRSHLAKALRLIYTQRFIRKLCPDCKSAAPVHPDTLRQLDIPPTFTFYAGSGCDACRHTGYRGTAMLGELLRMSPALCEMLENGASGSEVYTEGRHEGMLTLHERALNKAIDGTTSLEEVLGIFALPQGFDFKERLRLGRIGHLQKPDARQESTQERLASQFEADARKQAEPPEIDIFAGDAEAEGPEGGSKPAAEQSAPSAAEAPAAEAQPPESEAVDADMLRVLLLDDSPVMLQYTQHILSSAGIFSVQAAGTVEEAWDKLQQQYFHLVITDHEMPGQTGQQFIERIRQQPTLNHTGTMLLTGNVKEASALAGGADGFVGKPTDPELLIARARSIAEIYKRMSNDAGGHRPDEAAPPSPGAAGQVEFTEQHMKDIASFELDTQRFVVKRSFPKADPGD
jgi:type IV pilus assembly protein PilB